MKALPPLLLGVNIDHAATLRQARYREETASSGGGIEPDPLLVALLAEQAGADGITVHLREDRRHIQDDDVERLRESIQTRMNLEMAATPAMVRLALDIRPEAACLVPENRQEVTTEGGLDVLGQGERIRSACKELAAAGIAVSLFIDPEEEAIDFAVAAGAPMVELHTGSFARAGTDAAARRPELERLRKAAAYARSAGLTVNAGHGINYANIAEIRTIAELHELNIGHSILSRALVTGIGEAVAEMKRRMNVGRG